MANNKQFKIIFMASFFASISYGVMLTLPIYLTKNLNYPISFSGEVISLGIAGVLISIMALPSALKTFSNRIVSSLGSIVYFLAIVCIISGLKPLLFLSGFLLGFGWGVIYTMGPIMVSEASNYHNRSKNFSFISAFNMLGAGIAPILVKAMLDVDIDMVIILFAASIVSLFSGFLFLLTKTAVEIKDANKGNEIQSHNLISKRPMIPMLMVFLGACVFSSMMNFQSIIAMNKGLDFSYFYISYTVSVIFARFILTDIVNNIFKRKAMIVLLFIMCVSMGLFIVVENNYQYLIPSSLLGISYGLVYPLIQTAAVKDAKSDKERKKILTIFSFSYFIGVYGFPYFFSLAYSEYGYEFAFFILLGVSFLELISSILLFSSHKNKKSWLRPVVK